MRNLKTELYLYSIIIAVSIRQRNSIPKVGSTILNKLFYVAEYTVILKLRFKFFRVIEGSKPNLISLGNIFGCVDDLWQPLILQRTSSPYDNFVDVIGFTNRDLISSSVYRYFL